MEIFKKHYPLPITHYPLPITHYPLLIAIAVFVSMQSPSATAEDVHKGFAVERGVPGTLGTQWSALPALEVRANETSNGSAIDVLSRAGVAKKTQIPAMKIHNYGFGPGLQIDQVGPLAGIVIKQAANGNRMPESKGQVSNAAFLQMNRAAENGANGMGITVFDRLGNLRFNPDPRQKIRTIVTRDADLLFIADKGKVIVANQPMVIPRVKEAQDGRLFGALGMLKRKLSVWNGKTWRPLRYEVEGRRKRYKKYLVTMLLGVAGGVIGALAILFLAPLSGRLLQKHRTE